MAVTVSGCVQQGTGPDAAELRNIAPWNIVPKSSPAQLVTAFRQFCVEAPASRSAQEGKLRNASYVPTAPRNGNKPQVFLVDDRRPAIVVSDTTCMARAYARTGQTEKMNDYVASAFPDARPVSPDSLPKTFEQAWSVNLPDAAIIATERVNDLGNSSGYGLILHRPNRPRTN
ncbi:hypothetical protein [Ruegeria aquimaris]|uniref:Lipoprotein n=1 Tax=Ruegeria aquimaris TaxID=2984333 RepID=A0ABT3AH85_9RHOB|nr:hypothetical protein [Ruegeria sp. XHP0148]MCV2888051.1 hypothetical protein [Ruegeria sp. XHP0148]